MIRTLPFYFELCLRLMNFHRFPPFWHHVRNVSKCDKLVTITLFGIYLVNKMIKYDESRWICLRTVDFYISDAWKSIFWGKNENIQKVYSIGLWICLPWDFCASSWDHERSALGWGRVVQCSDKLNLCMALYCYENSVWKYKNKEQKIQWEIKQTHA